MQPTTRLFLLFTALADISIRENCEKSTTMAWGQNRLFLFLTAALLLLNGGFAARTEALAGGWRPIKNISDPHVQEIGEFAVTEHNKQAKESLKFQSVVSGETQVVSGTNYRLVVVAEDGGVSNKYEAVVWEKPWMGFRNLTSFTRV